MYSEPHMQHSCEVYRRGDVHRTLVYGRTRDEILADRAFLSRFFPPPSWQMQKSLYNLPPDWQDNLVVLQRSTALGLGSQWTRATRRRDEYGEVVR